MMNLFSLKTKGIGFLTTLLTLSFLSMGANKIGDVEIRDLTVTGVSTGVTAASAVPDWAISTSYGLNELVLDSNSGLQYRASSAHTSPGTGNITDDLANWQVIGSASSGVIVEDLGLISITPNANTWGAITGSEWYGVRRGNMLLVFGSFKTAACNAVDNYLQLPSGLTVDTSNVSSVNDTNLGTWVRHAAAGASVYTGNSGIVYYDRLLGDTGKIRVSPNFTGGQSGTYLDAQALCNTGDVFDIKFEVPIAEWSNAGVTVSIGDLTEETKWVDEGVVSVSWPNLQTIGNTTRFKATKDSNGIYTLHVKIAGVTSVGTTPNVVTLGSGFGTTFKADSDGTDHPMSQGAITGGRAIAKDGFATIEQHTTSNTQLISISGSAELAGKPDFFDANRENPQSVAAYITDIPINDWTNSTVYKKSSVVIDSTTTIQYRAIVDHTSPVGGDLLADSANWEAISSSGGGGGVIVTGWETYSPVFQGFGTVTDINMQWRRIGDSIEIQGDFTTGSPTASEARIDLPNGYSVAYLDTPFESKLVGRGAVDVASSGAFPTILATTTDTYLNVGANGSANKLLPVIGNLIFGISQRVSFFATVPIAEFQNSGITVSTADLTEETKWVTESVVPISIANASSGLAYGAGRFKAYKDSNGEYSIRGNVHVTANPLDSNFQILLDEPSQSVIFRNLDHQAVSVSVNSAGGTPVASTRGRTVANDNELWIQSLSSMTEVWVSFDVGLKTKPSWFDANRENPITASAFIETVPITDWAINTEYPLNSFVTDGANNLQYRATVEHTSPSSGTIVDDIGNWELIGSASNGVILEQVQEGALTLPNGSGGAAVVTDAFQWRRVGSHLRLSGILGFTGTTTPNATPFSIRLPNGLSTTDSIVRQAGSFSNNNTTQDRTFHVLRTFGQSGLLTDLNLTDAGAFGFNTFTVGGVGGTDADDVRTIHIDTLVPIAGWENEGVTVSIQDLTEETKWVTESVLALVFNCVTGSWTGVTPRGFVKARKDSSGQYYASGTVWGRGDNTGGCSQVTITAPSLTVKSLPDSPQFGTALFYDGGPGTAILISEPTVGGAGTFNAQSSSNFPTNAASGIAFHFSDVPLQSKPSWFDANRENPASIAAFVPEVTTTEAGIAIPPADMSDALATQLGHYVYSVGTVYNGGITLQVTSSVGTRASHGGKLILKQMSNGSWFITGEVTYTSTASNQTNNTAITVTDLFSESGSHSTSEIYGQTGGTYSHGIARKDAGGTGGWTIRDLHGQNSTGVVSTTAVTIMVNTALQAKPNWAW